MKIIVISRLFPPSSAIGAVRPYNFCKYLAESGHEIVCITDTIPNDMNSNKKQSNDKFDILTVSGNQMFQKGSTIIHHSKTERKGKIVPNQSKLFIILRRTAAQFIYILEETFWAHKAASIASRIIEDKKPELILTTFGPLSTVLVGQKIKLKYKKIIWISDMRDPMNSFTQQAWRRRLFQLIQLRMLHSANIITTVSDDLANMYGELLKKYRLLKPVYTIENGYEPGEFSTKQCLDGILKIGYTGSLYAGLRKIDALFQAIRFIHDERKMNLPLPIQIHYCGKDGKIFINRANDYGISDYVINHDVLNKDDSLKLQEECDVLCVLSWNTKYEKGIVTGKFAEYIRLRKPILSIVSGEISDSELTIRNDRLGAGFSFEYSRGADYQNLINWLMKMINMKIMGIELPSIPEEKALLYAYPNIVNKLETVILGEYPDFRTS